ncbi:MAG: 50S ribosomal protein L17 [Omnitrophica WOR_2 bacterium GWF2_38_59]|nr:MAG: 50S ribosomal protein L17 [Omnitrophica WOR_2 bacterium GWA2_37_7]OGX25216.1 MAG: 50S ribosomal protein L17 [Omnitrophica WOR_2 bacterium GWF2_38_59]OGX47888.1 MAG: 50S ribosomal protein L17 [Omnitrophica WOR_2 bacterium RIFOXYA2_FULL_38_17]OGX53544.1 MAG: 50S ribosomal protein L17 [Omnitrophica WOR_2 bacterium RIFOXYA12_FULL_38_10]OGX56225.1 MAG: 50S ribosomal protein L17 [Omnitrophica WOR_2 bacterium RIFOXYC2_FULL_38_12]OGX60270.1 MAG: 50S ribosomal protein L17 [Omnitrophica WOR_2 ba
MRHGISGNRLSRNSSLRKATMRDIAKAALLKDRISTTKAKAKEARKLVDKLITMGKKGTLAEKRRAYAVLCNHRLVSALFSDIAPRFKERQGGYTRIIPIGTRKGDNAELVFLELTEKKAIVVSKPKVKASSKTKVEKVAPEQAEVITKTHKALKVPLKDEANEPLKKKDQLKVEIKKGVDGKEKDKSTQRFSGIRKMFNKKSSGK